MNLQEFKQSLRIGLGRVIVFLKKHDSDLYRDAILDACLHNQTYDAQSEGDRSEYLFEVLQATENVEFYRERILQALRTIGGDWDTYQVYSLARLFAEHGDVDARTALYEQIAANIADDYFLGAQQLILLDGLDGFRFIARLRVEQAITDDLDDDDYWLGLVEERYSEEVARRELDAAAASEQPLATYVNAIHAFREQRDARKHERSSAHLVSYDEIRQLIARKPERSMRGVLFRWGQHASIAAVEQASADLLAETDRNRLIAYLRLFQERLFPLDHTKLLALAEDPDEELSTAAVNALEQINHETVRALALELIVSAGRQADGVQLLHNNYEAGDHVLIEAVLAQPLHDQDLHGIGMAVLDIIEDEPWGDDVTILTMLYEKGPCSYCRERFVDLLLKLDKVPDWMRIEAQYDANPELRAKMRGAAT